MSHIESNCGEFAVVKPLEFDRFNMNGGCTIAYPPYKNENASINGGCAIALAPFRVYPPYHFHAHNLRRVDKRSASTNRLAA
jgi:hypothetical protein